MLCSSPQIAAKLLSDHGFPRFFRDVVLRQHHRYGDDLDIWFESPDEFYRLLADEPEGMPFSDRIIPLHESNYEFFCCYVPPPLDMYIEHSIEWSPEDYRVVAETRNAYLEYELERLWSHELGTDAMRRCAKLFGYEKIDEFLSTCER